MHQGYGWSSGYRRSDRSGKQRWWSLKLLDRAARKLSEKVDSRVYDDWDHAYLLHTEGSHKARLDLEQVRARMRYIEELLRIARKVVVAEQRE